MSLFPLFIQLAEQSFLRSMRMPQYLASQPRLCYIENWGNLQSQPNGWVTNKDGFHVNVDVKDFTPNEISVKTVDNTIVVEGKHEERQDKSGFISRQFTRRYTIPDGYNVKDVISQLSVDGILTLKAPPRAIEDSNVRTINIEQTGTAFAPIKNEEKNE